MKDLIKQYRDTRRAVRQAQSDLLAAHLDGYEEVIGARAVLEAAQRECDAARRRMFEAVDAEQDAPEITGPPCPVCSQDDGEVWVMPDDAVDVSSDPRANMCRLPLMYIRPDGTVSPIGEDES
jgi:hypothetical protein